MSRTCRLCHRKIPWRITINDKCYHLTNRKFCLKCSPFKQHNTHPENPNTPKGLRKKRTTQQNKKYAQTLLRRGHDRKNLLINRSGGGCTKCGYNKSQRALTFHHLDPTKKLFGLSLNNLWSKTMEVIEKEYAKCVLLCMNCHAEIEDEKLLR